MTRVDQCVQARLTDALAVYNEWQTTMPEVATPMVSAIAYRVLDLIAKPHCAMITDVQNLIHSVSNALNKNPDERNPVADNYLRMLWRYLFQVRDILRGEVLIEFLYIAGVSSRLDPEEENSQRISGCCRGMVSDLSDRTWSRGGNVAYMSDQLNLLEQWVSTFAENPQYSEIAADIQEHVQSIRRLYVGE